ncbi:DUF2948 family protein [Consotaella salsifontis]|uniref:DUF2948 domain-containing protein n=1 Tax=Consotaella salsifontis TaxID=1365950 RepID=A0A1T4Q3S8_9HYPH|nr:DUF2948 family protein [Consotaella salsifontis]SJZ98187.1 Protein of unknown function [Consotaella salsifontis]
MDPLRLIAVDEDDLAILSAHCQDAVLKLGECQYRPQQKQFVMAINRFAWEKANPSLLASLFGGQTFERRRAALHFNRVEKVHQEGLASAPADTVLSLLAIRFSPTDAPSGHVTLVFAGGSTIRLDVECIEAQLSDLGAAWSTSFKPDHDKG